MRVAILYGGVSEEHEVSVASARSVLAAIDRSKYDIVPVAITKSGTWLLPERAPDRLTGALPAVDEAGTAIVLRPESGALAVGEGPVDVVFPLLHGPGGEDGTVQGMLDVLGIPYVGAGVAASAVGMDKSLQKPVFAAAGIPVTPWLAVRASDNIDELSRRAIASFGLPLFTKPANLGSSVGVSKCKNEAELAAGIETAFAHGSVALIEKAIDGRELECAVLGNDEPEASVVGEIVPANEFYDYEAKYLNEGSKTIVPADIPDGAAQIVRTHAVQAFKAIGCAGMARVDFFLSSSGDVYLNEINTIPGFTPISMYPKLWEATGVPYAKLIDRLIELALERRA
ncbi:MAG: D-alanine--D-alanine ligase [Actinobacteria bacterium]|nr:D-alanine--D-alanine ligase [Actinomycetota bacterium]